MNQDAPSQGSMESILNGFMESGDAQSFMAMALRIKQSAIAMIEHNAISDAISCLDEYKLYLRSHQSGDAGFNERVISLYPVNESCTYRMLGQSDTLDQFILSKKTDISSMVEMRKPPYAELFRHALLKSDSALFNLLLGEMLASIDTMPRNSSYTHAVGRILVALTYSIGSTEKTPLAVKVNPEFDSILSAEVRTDSDHGVRWSTLSRMVEFGFARTVRSCLVSGRAKSQEANDDPYLQNILSVFEGESPFTVFSAMALVRVHSRRDKHQLAFIKTLLGDSRFDFERFIELSATANQFRAFGLVAMNPRLGFHHLAYFGKWLSPEHLTTELERKRAGWLVRQVCAAETEAYIDGKLCVTGMRMKNRNEPVLTYVKKMLNDTGIHPGFHQFADIIKRDALSVDLNI
ncbi:hypothetical protein P5704_026890 (plasmid) [Pseudomonas sp. FeN3W]|nr:hypothetical protein P5704_026890 [Pseudomonas sp. FeN3W]